MMRETKRVFMMYPFYDRTGIEAYLQEQAAKGWLLDEISAFGWRFSRTTKKALHYAVTYFPKASSFDPGPSDQLQEFHEFCAHTGWQLVASNAQMQIFRNEQEHPIPIETEASIQVANIHKSVKRSYLPTTLLLLFNGILQMAMFLWRMNNDVIEVLSNNLNLFSGFCWIFVLVIALLELGMYVDWYRRAKKAAMNEGRFVETKNIKNLQVATLAVMLTGLCIMICSLGDRGVVFTTIGTIVMIFVITAVVIAFSNWMKKKKTAANVNRNATLLLTVLLSIALVGVIPFLVIRSSVYGGSERDELDTYEYNGRTFTAHKDTLPLMLNDLFDTTEYGMERYSCYLYETESILLGEIEAFQSPRFDSLDLPHLDYTVIRVKHAFLYDWCLKEMLELRDHYSMDVDGNIIYDEYRSMDATPWRAAKAYRYYHGGVEASDQYVVCYEDYIIKLNADWELTPEQMAVVGETLGSQ